MICKNKLEVSSRINLQTAALLVGMVLLTGLFCRELPAQRKVSPHAQAVARAEDGASLTRTETSDEQGRRVIQVIDGERMIRISERPEQGITVTVLETLRGADKVNRYSGKNALALKARHPRGYELYQKYKNAPELGALVEAPEKTATPETTAGTSELVRARMRQLERENAQLRTMMQTMMSGGPRRGFSGGSSQNASAFRRAFATDGARASASARARASSSTSTSGTQSGQSSSQNSSGNFPRK